MTMNLGAEVAFRIALAAVEAAWEAGCPDAGSDPARRAAVARRAVRRWGSALRRGVSTGRRVDDLAAGLVAAFEPKPELVGPLPRDYDYLAACIATALHGQQADA